MHRLFLHLVAVLLLIACNSRPDGVMSQGKMEDVLYDYHIARAVVQSQGTGEGERDMTYEEAVFRKHNVTADEFYASLRYYEAHPKTFANIYTNLEERFGRNQLAQQRDKKDAQDSQQGNDLWPAARFFVLSSREVNRQEFDIPVPQMVQAGDRFEWSFDLQWVYPEGRKNGTALIVLHYDNDSTATFSQPLYGTGHQTLIASVSHVLPKRISGFIYQECAWNKKACLLLVSNVSLRHIAKSRTPSPAPIRSASSDTLKKPQTAMQADDSILPLPDTLPQLQPELRKGRRISRSEGERRILDSIRREERGRRQMCK